MAWPSVVVFKLKWWLLGRQYAVISLLIGSAACPPNVEKFSSELKNGW
ncbi:MAG: hypothetical protein Q7U38_07015 [Methylobacter sp.]|nr:hypothetical protein [Methylobacter sp.]MDP2099313.1 hypothetical protein [Methylobacter sp.]MDP2428483.1 hypothetical protein [Methylobacter sp.]MDP3055174.1 hypothetical protein [Methylobacter sp.]MDP3363674.1 hypothetical protein [Methylobacter sp.]